MINARRSVWVVGAVWALGAGAAEVEAQLDWVRRVELGTLVSGVVTESEAVPGERVAAGKVLLRLDQRGFRARLEEARAKAAGMTLALSEAKRELERAQELYDRTVLSDHELVEAKIAFSTAEQAARSAEAGLAQAELDLQYSEIRAPFDAVVIKRNAQVGQVVATQFQALPLVVVAEAGRMAAHTEVDAETAARLVAGSPVKVRVGGTQYAGELRSVGLEAMRQGGGLRYDAVVIFETKTQILRAGQSARVEWQ